MQTASKGRDTGVYKKMRLDMPHDWPRSDEDWERIQKDTALRLGVSFWGCEFVRAVSKARGSRGCKRISLDIMFQMWS